MEDQPAVFRIRELFGHGTVELLDERIKVRVYVQKTHRFGVKPKLRPRDDLAEFLESAEAAGQSNARAENIAYGQPNPAAVMDAWMDSSGHRANILNCELTALGVGIAEGPGGPWWTQLFGD